MSEGTAEQIEKDLRTAMRNKDPVKTRTLRTLKAAVKTQELEKGRGSLTEEDVIAVLGKQAKQRRESIDQFRDAGREDLAQKEEEELAVIGTYLPEQMDADEIESAVREVIDDTGAASPSDMGRVMGAIMPKVKGRADGNLVRQTVMRLLAENN